MPSPGYVRGPLVIPLTFQVVLHWLLPNNVLASNVLHAIVGEGETPTLELANGVMSDLSSASDFIAFCNYLSPHTSLTKVSIKDLQTALQVGFDSDGDAVPGTSADNALPEEVAFCVTLRTGTSGPAGRGRIYLGGLAANAVTEFGLADPDFVGVAKAFVGSIMTVINGHGMDLGVGHRGHAEYTNRKFDIVPAELPGTARVLTVAVADNKFDSQRRRK